MSRHGKATYASRSITVNLTPELDKYVRTRSKRTKKSMNEIINKAVMALRGAGR